MTAKESEYKKLINTALDLCEDKQYQDALILFDKAIIIEPTKEHAWINKGACLAQLLEPDKALECFNRALDLNENSASTWYNKGTLLMNLERYDEAVICFTNAIKISPNNDESWANKGRSLAGLCRDEEALQVFIKALEINSKLRPIWIYQKHDKATELFLQAATNFPSNVEWAWIELGNHYAWKSEYKEALQWFEKAKNKNPHNPFVYDRIAHSYDAIGEKDKAIEFMKTAVSLDPEYLGCLGRMYSSIDRHDLAIECFEKELDLFTEKAVKPCKRIFIERRRYLELGKEAADSRQYELGLRYFHLALKVVSTCPVALSDIGITLAELKKYGEAIEYFDEVIKHHPEYTTAYRGKGWVNLEIKAYDEAYKLFKKANELNPNDEEIALELKNAETYLLEDYTRTKEDLRREIIAREAFERQVKKEKEEHSCIPGIEKNIAIVKFLELFGTDTSPYENIIRSFENLSHSEALEIVKNSFQTLDFPTTVTHSLRDEGIDLVIDIPSEKTIIRIGAQLKSHEEIFERYIYKTINDQVYRALGYHLDHILIIIVANSLSRKIAKVKGSKNQYETRKIIASRLGEIKRNIIKGLSSEKVTLISPGQISNLIARANRRYREKIVINSDSLENE